MPQDALQPLRDAYLRERKQPPPSGSPPGLDEFARQQGATVTSRTGGRHNPGSAHYAGRAIDVRTRDRSGADVEALQQAAQAEGFKVRDERQRPAGQQVWGGPHLHVETDALTPLRRAYSEERKKSALPDIDRIGQEAGLSPRALNLVRGMAMREGGKVATRTSSKGAQGPLQVKPGTGLAYVSPQEWATQEGKIRAGVLYVKKLDQMFGGDPYYVAAAYHAGEGRIKPYYDSQQPIPRTAQFFDGHIYTDDHANIVKRNVESLGSSALQRKRAGLDPRGQAPYELQIEAEQQGQPTTSPAPPPPSPTPSLRKPTTRPTPAKPAPAKPTLGGLAATALLNRPPETPYTEQTGMRKVATALASEIPNRVRRGVFNFLASLPEGAARAFDDAPIPNLINAAQDAGYLPKLAPLVRPLTDKATALIKKIAPVDEANKGFWTATAPEAAGSALGFAVPTIITGGAGVAPMVTRAIPTVLGALSNAQQIGRELDDAKVTDWSKRHAAMGAALLAGASESVGMGGRVAQLAHRIGLDRGLRGYVADAFKEGGQEYAQQYANDLIARYIGQYDLARDLSPLERRKLEAGAAGLLLGGVMGGGEAILGRRIATEAPEAVRPMRRPSGTVVYPAAALRQASRRPVVPLSDEQAALAQGLGDVRDVAKDASRPITQAEIAAAPRPLTPEEIQAVIARGGAPPAPTAPPTATKPTPRAAPAAGTKQDTEDYFARKGGLRPTGVAAPTTEAAVTQPPGAGLRPIRGAAAPTAPAAKPTSAARAQRDFAVISDEVLAAGDARLAAEETGNWQEAQAAASREAKALRNLIPLAPDVETAQRYRAQAEQAETAARGYARRQTEVRVDEPGTAPRQLPAGMVQTEVRTKDGRTLVVTHPRNLARSVVQQAADEYVAPSAPPPPATTLEAQPREDAAFRQTRELPAVRAPQRAGPLSPTQPLPGAGEPPVSPEVAPPPPTPRQQEREKREARRAAILREAVKALKDARQAQREGRADDARIAAQIAYQQYQAYNRGLISTDPLHTEAAKEHRKHQSEAQAIYENPSVLSAEDVPTADLPTTREPSASAAPQQVEGVSLPWYTRWDGWEYALVPGGELTVSTGMGSQYRAFLFGQNLGSFPTKTKAQQAAEAAAADVAILTRKGYTPQQIRALSPARRHTLAGVPAPESAPLERVSAEDYAAKAREAEAAQQKHLATAIVDDDGQPLTVYRGVTGTSGGQRSPTSALGDFFTADPGLASEFAGQGGSVKQGTLVIRNPYRMSWDDARAFKTAEDAQRFRSNLQSQGYDGILIGPTGVEEIVAFRPEQFRPVEQPAPTTARLPQQTLPSERLPEPPRIEQPRASETRPFTPTGELAARAETAEQAPKGEAGHLSYFAYQSGMDARGKRIPALVEHPQVRDLLDLRSDAGPKDVLNALAALAGVPRSSQMDVPGLRKAYAALRDRARERGMELAADLTDAFKFTAVNYRKRKEAHGKFMADADVNAIVDYVHEQMAQGNEVPRADAAKLRLELSEIARQHGLSPRWIEKTFWPKVVSSAREAQAGTRTANRTGGRGVLQPGEPAEPVIREATTGRPIEPAPVSRAVAPGQRSSEPLAAAGESAPAQPARERAANAQPVGAETGVSRAAEAPLETIPPKRPPISLEEFRQLRALRHADTAMLGSTRSSDPSRPETETWRWSDITDDYNYLGPEYASREEAIAHRPADRSIFVDLALEPILELHADRRPPLTQRGQLPQLLFGSRDGRRGRDLVLWFARGDYPILPEDIRSLFEGAGYNVKAYEVRGFVQRALREQQFKVEFYDAEGEPAVPPENWQEITGLHETKNVTPGRPQAASPATGERAGVGTEPAREGAAAEETGRVRGGAATPGRPQPLADFVAALAAPDTEAARQAVTQINPLIRQFGAEAVDQALRDAGMRRVGAVEPQIRLADNRILSASGVRSEELPRPRGEAASPEEQATPQYGVQNPWTMPVEEYVQARAAAERQTAQNILNHPDASARMREEAQKFLDRLNSAEGLDRFRREHAKSVLEAKRTTPTRKGAATEEKVTPRTLTHPNPAIDGKPIVAKTADGRVIVPNPENKGGISRVKEQPTQAAAATPREALNVSPAKPVAPTGTQVLHRFQGDEGMESHVARIRQGYSVTLYDTDSGEYVPRSRIFKNEDAAIDYARTVAVPAKQSIPLPEPAPTAQTERDSSVLVSGGVPAGQGPLPVNTPVLEQAGNRARAGEEVVAAPGATTVEWDEGGSMRRGKLLGVTPTGDARIALDDGSTVTRPAEKVREVKEESPAGTPLLSRPRPADQRSLELAPNEGLFAEGGPAPVTPETAPRPDRAREEQVAQLTERERARQQERNAEVFGADEAQTLERLAARQDRVGQAARTMQTARADLQGRGAEGRALAQDAMAALRLFEQAQNGRMTVADAARQGGLFGEQPELSTRAQQWAQAMEQGQFGSELAQAQSQESRPLFQRGADESNITRHRLPDVVFPNPADYAPEALAENARAQYRPAANRPGVVAVNEAAHEVVNSALAARGEGERLGGSANFSPETARALAEQIRTNIAPATRSEAGKANLLALARALETAAESGAAGVSLLKVQPGLKLGATRRTIRHETFHTIQRAINPDVLYLTTPGWLESQPHAQNIRTELNRLGYTADEHTVEAAAFIASGDWARFGMDTAAARQFLNDYFHNIEWKHGRAALDNFSAVHPALRGETAYGRASETGTTRRAGETAEIMGGRREGAAAAGAGATGRGLGAGEGVGRGGGGLSERDAGRISGATGEAAGRTREGVIESPEFQRWFGDSKVVDAQGKPKVMYHGTTADFEAFDPKRQDKEALYGPGFYFTESPTVAGGKADTREIPTYHDTREQAEAQPDRRGFVRQDTTDGAHGGQWIAKVERPTLSRPGYVHKTGGAIPEVERTAYADAIKNSAEYQQLTDPTYPMLTQWERDVGMKGEFDRFASSGDLNRLHALQAQPYNLPVREILEDAGLASAGQTMPVYVRIERPFDLDATYTERDARRLWNLTKHTSETFEDAFSGFTSRTWSAQPRGASHDGGIRGEDLWHWLARRVTTNAAQANKLLQRAGYDGLTHIGGKLQGAEPHRVYIAFDPTQIKSAIGNRGTFDPDNSSILQQRGDADIRAATREFLQDETKQASATDFVRRFLSEEAGSATLPRYKKPRLPSLDAAQKQLNNWRSRYQRYERELAWTGERVDDDWSAKLHEATSRAITSLRNEDAHGWHKAALEAEELLRERRVDEPRLGRVYDEADRAYRVYKKRQDLAGKDIDPQVAANLEAYGGALWNAEQQGDIQDYARTHAELRGYMQRLTDNTEPATLGDKARIYRAGAHFFNPKFFLKNVISPTAVYAGALADNAAATTMAKAYATFAKLPLVNKVMPQPRSAPRLLNPLAGARGLREGLSLAYGELESGRSVDPLYGLHPSAFTGKSIGDRIGRGVETGLFWVNRFADDTFYQGFFRTKLDEISREYAGRKDVNFEQIVEQAALEAERLSFRDKNWVSKSADLFRRKTNQLFNTVFTAGLNRSEKFGVGDFILPYTQYTGAALKRALEHSPLGLIDVAIAAGKPGAFRGRNVRNALAHVLTGTAATFGAGMALGAFGMLTGPEPDKPDERKAELQRGRRAYALNVSALRRFFASGFQPQKLQDGDQQVQIDWLQPWAMTLAIGVAVQDVWRQREAEGKIGSAAQASLEALYDSLASSLDVMGDQSLFKNFQTYIKEGVRGMKWAGEDATEMERFNAGVWNVAYDIADDIVASNVPTILNQIRQYEDPTRRSTWVMKPGKRKAEVRDMGLTALPQEMGKRVQAKIPYVAGRGLGPLKPLPPIPGPGGQPTYAPKLEDNTLLNTLVNPATMTTYRPGAAGTPMRRPPTGRRPAL